MFRAGGEMPLFPFRSSEAADVGVFNGSRDMGDGGRAFDLSWISLAR